MTLPRGSFSIGIAGIAGFSSMVALLVMSHNGLFRRSLERSTLNYKRELDQVESETRDAVDQASWESFPASDAPGWRL